MGTCKLTKTIKSIVTIGKAKPTSDAFRQDVIEPKNKIANVPVILAKLLIISIAPRMDGCLKTRIFRDEIILKIVCCSYVTSPQYV